MKVYALFVDGDVVELIKDDEFWVDKDGDYGLCFDTNTGGLPDGANYPFIKFFYDIKTLNEAVVTLNWVKGCIKESLSWSLDK